ncbi:MAG: DUF3300 domain-containing protein [Acidobacteria bacterium]|nr:MAG: DUF3300 domain-containing protein [Acidobacteriota bacterium]
MLTLARRLRSQLTAVVCSMLLIPQGLSAVGLDISAQQGSAPEEQAPKIPNDQLDSLVAPIALYPDPLLAQLLAASSYPLEIMQLQQWLTKHKDLKDKALQDAVMKQPWDPTVQSLAALPDVVKRLSDDIQWTTDLGNAVLAQQSDVMDAVQRMRAKAKDKGNLKSNDQMTVETKVIEHKQVIVVEQSKPDVVYVPSYDPTVVYGPPAYPYPPIYYPPPGYYAAGMAISFGVGMMVGAAWGGGWCCNTFVNNSNRQNNISNRSGNRTGSNNWQHNSQHRGGTPYSNRATASKYGGTTRGDSAGSRQGNARQNQGQLGGRGQGAQADNMDRSGRQQSGAGNRGGSGTNSPGNRSGSGGDRIGNRSVSSGGGSKGGGAFAGGSGGSSGANARASSSRGASSMGSRGGGRGGGGRRR